MKKIPNSTYYTYKNSDEVLANGGQSVNSSVYYIGMKHYSVAYTFTDGAFLYFDECDKDKNISQMVYIVLDVNGAKGPNKWGYDVYWMHFSPHDWTEANPDGKTRKVIITDSLASLKEKGGKFPREILRNSE